MNRRKSLRYIFTVGKLMLIYSKVMPNSLLRDFYVVSLFFVVHCRIQRKVKATEGCIAHYFEYISIYLPTVNM